MPGDIPDDPFTPPPGPHPPSQFPPAIAAPPVPDSFLPLTPVQPDTPVASTLVVPPNIPDEHMTSPQKRQLDFPVSERPSTKLVLLCPRHRCLTRLHLHIWEGDDKLAFSTPVVQNTKSKKKPDNEPQEDEEDAGDLDAQPSGQNLPLAEDDEEQPESQPEEHAASDIPDAPNDVEEGEEESDGDSDETIDYRDLYVDESSWSWLSAEQKLCSNAGSFTVPRYIDGVPVDLKSVPSYADFVTPSSHIAEKKRQLIRKNYADISGSLLRRGGRQSLLDRVPV